MGYIARTERRFVLLGAVGLIAIGLVEMIAGNFLPAVLFLLAGAIAIPSIRKSLLPFPRVTAYIAFACAMYTLPR